MQYYIFLSPFVLSSSILSMLDPETFGFFVYD